ncbi:hypothetical protein DFH07DRAFT_765988 [Mycena maculata]|uniref:F-box domain-containing protein n=1 Tax=Mycena maculata TaxID=230809 RepID=A0AAD7K5I8_9AGAR|nr:hypothetical protein DFH07DRAFT_765988 [Mycena maculata]
MSTADLRRRLVQLDAAIVAQKRALAELQRDRETVQCQLDASSTFPALQLPVEITIEIFTLCLPTIEQLREDKRLSMSEKLKSDAPTLFLGVCRAWRDIALSIPALWATLSLRFHTIDDDVAAQVGRVEDFIERWLNRAAHRPLSIAFYAECTLAPFTKERMRDIIHRYAHRIQDLELEWSRYEMDALQLHSAVFPLLQRATLGDIWEDGHGAHDTVPLFTNAPQLRDFHLTRDGLFSHYILPSLQLTRFDGDIDYDLDLFSLAPNLIEARCRVVDLEDTPDSPIIHSQLQDLTLVKYPGLTAQRILPHLTLPALQSFHISGLSTDMSTVWTLYSFLVRSSPPLRTLSILDDDEIGNLYYWKECFDLLEATLEHLEVVSPRRNFQGLVFNSFPHLQSLSFVDPRGVDYKALLDFLDQRTNSPATLRSFRITCDSLEDISTDVAVTSPGAGQYSFQSNEVADHLASLASRGLDIHIGTSRKNYVEHVRPSRVS